MKTLILIFTILGIMANASAANYCAIANINPEAKQATKQETNINLAEFLNLKGKTLKPAKKSKSTDGNLIVFYVKVRDVKQCIDLGLNILYNEVEVPVIEFDNQAEIIETYELIQAGLIAKYLDEDSGQIINSLLVK